MTWPAGSLHSSEYFTIGKVLSAFHLTPLLANRADGLAPESADTKPEHFNELLIIESVPRENITAHKRTERMSTWFLSKMLLLLLISVFSEHGETAGTSGW